MSRGRESLLRLKHGLMATNQSLRVPGHELVVSHVTVDLRSVLQPALSRSEVVRQTCLLMSFPETFHYQTVSEFICRTVVVRARTRFCTPDRLVHSACVVRSAII